MRYVEPYYDESHTIIWLNWKSKNDMWNFGNAVMYIVNMLQYMRDWFNKKEAQYTIDSIYDYLLQIQDKETGLWIEDAEFSPSLLSRGVQITYHIWELFFYDKRTMQYMERAIDSILATQNSLGGYSVKSNSSGCEDIDSIIPLVRFSFLTDYRKDDIKRSLEKAFSWVMSNRNEDGGFVNMRDKAFKYGHQYMRNEANQSDLFSTWWRPLSLAYMSKVIDNETLRSVKWQFVNSPGYVFWNA